MAAAGSRSPHERLAQVRRAGLAVVLLAAAVVALAIGLHGIVAWPANVGVAAQETGAGVEVSLRRDEADPERPAALPADTAARLAQVRDVLAAVSVGRGGNAALECGGDRVEVAVAELPPEPPPAGRPLLAGGVYPTAANEILVGYKRAHKCGLTVGSAVALEAIAAGDDDRYRFDGVVAGLTGTTPWDAAVPSGAFETLAGEDAERVVLLQVDEHVKRSTVRNRVREALPEVPARALKTVDVRDQVEEDTGSWRLAATMLGLGGLVAGGLGMALAYAAAGAVGGAGLLGVGMALGIGLGGAVTSTPTEFQLPAFGSGADLQPAAVGAGALLGLTYGMALAPATRRRTRLGALLRWSARRPDALSVGALALLAVGVWVYGHGFVDRDLVDEPEGVSAIRTLAGLAALAAPLLWLRTRDGRRAWDTLRTAPPGEPGIGRVAAMLAALGGVIVFFGAVWLLGTTVEQAEVLPAGLILLAELLLVLALAHEYAAFRLRPGAVGPYRTLVALAVFWALPILTAPLALLVALFLLMPATRRYYLGAAAGERAATAAAAAASADHDGAPEPALSADALVMNSALLAPLPTEWRRRLAELATTERYWPGAVVLREGELGQDLYGVSDGRLEVEGIALGGEVLPLAELEPGDWFGEMALVTAAPRSATVRSLTLAQVVRVPASALLPALGAVPEFRAALEQRWDYLDMVGCLQRFSPFGSLPQPVLLAIARRFHRRRLAAGTLLLCAGEPADAWYLIKRGRAEARWPTGRRLALGPGDGCGEEALLAGSRSAYDVVATSDLEVLELARADFETALATNRPLRRFFEELVRARYAGAPDQPLGLPDPVSTLMPGLSRRDRSRVWWVLATGVALLVVLTILAAATGSGVAIVATVLLGSWLGPAVYLRYLSERDLLRTLSFWRLAGIALATAVLGIPGALVLSSLLPSGAGDFGPALLTGLIEEAAKLLGVVWLLWRRRYRFELDGILFGVAAGMVFAGLEDMLYAQSSYEHADSPEQALSAMLVTVWLRAITTFVGHGVWTGLICAAIWRGKGTGGPRWDWQVLGAYLFSSLLHGLWDWSPAVFMVPVGLVGTLLLRERIQRASEAEQQAAAALALAAPSGTVFAVDEQAASHCPVCGLERAPGSRYCVRCGAALTIREPASS